MMFTYLVHESIEKSISHICSHGGRGTVSPHKIFKLWAFPSKKYEKVDEISFLSGIVENQIHFVLDLILIIRTSIFVFFVNKALKPTFILL